MNLALGEHEDFFIIRSEDFRYHTHYERQESNLNCAFNVGFSEEHWSRRCIYYEDA